MPERLKKSTHTSMNPNKFSLKSRFGSFRFALNGILSLLKNEHNSRIHLFAAIVAVIMGIILNLDHYEWLFLAIVIGSVFITELLNSSIESLADLIDPKWNVQIMKAKDYGAAAVLISAIIAIVVGCLIFIPKLLTKL
jgi:diacylglycerol kinase (ATP)